jgi:hypothetical protein
LFVLEKVIVAMEGGQVALPRVGTCLTKLITSENNTDKATGQA